MSQSTLLSATILLLTLGLSLEILQRNQLCADEVSPHPVGDLASSGDLEDLEQVEALAAAWNSGRWEDALKRYLELSDKLQLVCTHWVTLDGIDPGDQVYFRMRDRAWRHVRDRLAVIDQPGRGQQMLKLLPRLDRILLICTVTGMPGPDEFHRVRDRWQRRTEMRILSDRWLDDLQLSLLDGDEEKAAELLRLLDSLPWIDEQIQELRDPMILRASERLRDGLHDARQLNDPGTVLDTCQRMRYLGISDPELLQEANWALEELKSRARHNLDLRRDAHALLQMARLVVEEVALPHVLDGLRKELTLPLRPRIWSRYQRPADIYPSPADHHTLIPGAIVIREEFLAEPHGEPESYEPVGRHWIRSPDHMADAKRWVDQIEDILSLSRRWLESPASEAGLIRDRIRFHADEARRLALRLENNPARRSRVVWKLQSKSQVHTPIKVTVSCPVTILTGDGREIGTAVEMSEILLPRVIEGVQLPVRSLEIEAAHRRLRARIPAEIDRLADRWASDRLAKALDSARQLAKAGEATAALELLLPALLGAGNSDTDLQAQAVADLAQWSGLGDSAVVMALGGSETP